MIDDHDPIGQPPPTSLTLPLDRLQQGLTAFVERMREASLIYDQDRMVDDGRRGCMVALTAAIDICQVIGLSSDEDRTFFRLLLALQNADRGAEDALITRKPLGVKGPVSIVSLRQRGYVAAAIEALHQDGSGRKVKEAAQWVVPRVRKLNAVREIGAKREVWQALKGWRDAAIAGQYKVDWDATTYRDACDAMKAIGVTGERAALRLLTDAAELG